MVRRWFLLVAGLTLAASCGRAHGTVEGGDLTDAGQLAIQVVPGPCGIKLPILNRCGGGNCDRWSDLYRDIFGPGGTPDCAQASCHGSPNGAGIKEGIQCFDSLGCYNSIFNPSGQVRSTDFGNPNNSILLGTTLRRCVDAGSSDLDPIVTGLMPKEPSNAYFSEDDLTRIGRWIDAGAPYDGP
jgi:hypothetical protein